MNTIQTIDRISLQRLVDGELDHQERAALLAQLDREPTLWRHVALAFVEDKAITKEVRQEQSLIPTAEFATPTVLTSSAAPRLDTYSNWKTILSLAASLLLVLAGFAIGSRIGKFGQPNAVGSPNVALSPESKIEDSIENSGSTLVKAESLRTEGGEGFAGTLRLPGQSKDIPIYEPTWLEEHLLGRKELELRKVEDQLRPYGLGLNVQIQTLEGQLPDGRKVVVPFRQVGLQRIDW